MCGFQSTPSVKRVTAWPCAKNPPSAIFQSTPSVKRVTRAGLPNTLNFCYFNPHPLWRGWPLYLSHSSYFSYFNPHPLWRGWHDLGRWKFLLPQFQSTPSVKRVTLFNSVWVGSFVISIHTLCEEGDLLMIQRDRRLHHFNPHPLWRGWLVDLSTMLLLVPISIHTLCEEGDTHPQTC